MLALRQRRGGLGLASRLASHGRASSSAGAAPGSAAPRLSTWLSSVAARSRQPCARPGSQAQRNKLAEITTPASRALAAATRSFAAAALSHRSGAGSKLASRHAHPPAKARLALKPRRPAPPPPTPLWLPPPFRSLAPGYSARLATINALGALQPRWGCTAALFLAELLSRHEAHTAWCFSSPVTAGEQAYLESAAREDAAKAAASARGWGSLKASARAALRLLWLSFVFAPVVALVGLAWRPGLPRRTWLRLLRASLERGGPAFIKWGQWAATRRDLFPPDLCQELERLHSSAPAHEAWFTDAAIEEAFGFRRRELFEEFDARPVASGSIGQVHRATLSKVGARLTGAAPGTRVAVKVRHPGVCDSIERDFALMQAAAAMLGRLPGLAHLRLGESLEQFAAPLREQVDLGREAYYLHQFNYNFRDVAAVSFPVPHYPLVAPGVLVESFEEGRHISAYVAQGPGAPFNSTLAIIGAQTMLHMMIVDSLVHADLHPGNILVRLHTLGGRAGERLVRGVRGALRRAGAVLKVDLDPPAEWLTQPRIVLLDAGMATSLSAEDGRNMCGLFDCFSRLDGRGVAEWILRFSDDQQSCADPEAFKREVEENFRANAEADMYAHGNESNGAEALAHVLDLCRAHRVNLPGHICATVVTTLVLEGWSHDLDPAHSTLAEVQRVVAAARGGWRAWLGTVADANVLQRIPSFDEPVATGGKWDPARLFSWNH